ncbi:MAG TPA: hypothetical protein VEX86_04680 [Longimicrobium sp.]|nr:hypothetical protein [Longimicrobium sp.]
MTRRAIALLSLLAIPAIASCDRAPTEARARQTGTTDARRDGTPNASVVAAVRLSGNYTLGVVASNNNLGTTSGTAVLYSATGDVVASIDILCISKPGGGRAKLSGSVNESSDTAIEGFDAYFEVQDGVPDQAGKVILAETDGPTCLDSPEFDMETIAAGTVIVS